MQSVFSLRRRCNLRCVGCLVSQYEASPQYSFSRSDLKCHRYCTRDGCAECFSRNLIIQNDRVRALVTFEA